VCVTAAAAFPSIQEPAFVDPLRCPGCEFIAALTPAEVEVFHSLSSAGVFGESLTPTVPVAAPPFFPLKMGFPSGESPRPLGPAFSEMFLAPLARRLVNSSEKKPPFLFLGTGIRRTGPPRNPPCPRSVG